MRSVRWAGLVVLGVVLGGCDDKGYGGVCLSDGICSDIWSEAECATSASYAEWHEGGTCGDLGYTVSCNDGTDFRCRAAGWQPDDPAGGGGCSNSCNGAYDGYCDDGGPDADYAICTLGTDCSDCGPRGGSSSFDPSEEPDDPAVDDASSLYSTLCYEVTTTAGGENIEVNCTSNASTGCDVFGLRQSEYVYSSRSVCLTDARNVLDHWQRTGEIGGATPDVDPSASGAGGQGGSGGASGAGGAGGSGGGEIRGELCHHEWVLDEPLLHPPGTYLHGCRESADGRPCSSLAGAEWKPGPCPSAPLMSCCNSAGPFLDRTMYYSDSSCDENCDYLLRFMGCEQSTTREYTLGACL